MPQSPELAGGAGFTFEGKVAAFYYAAMLAEASAPGINDRIVHRVSVQQRDFGSPLDDVIVDFIDAATGEEARLSLQVKSSLIISDAETNKDFRDIIHDCWATFNGIGFRSSIDRYGAAVGTVSANKARNLKTLCAWAHDSLTTEHFNARFAPDGSAGQNIRHIKNDIVSLLQGVKGEPCTDDEVHLFLAHFVLIQFDFLSEGGIDSPEAINHVRGCIAPTDADKSPLVWVKLIQLARDAAGTSGQFDRMRLVSKIAPLARLRGAHSIRADLNTLTELAKSYASLIPDDIGGTKLERSAIFDKLREKHDDARITQAAILKVDEKANVLNDGYTIWHNYDKLYKWKG